jgi:hypothetical protein
MPRDDRSVLDHHTLKSAPWRGLPYLSVPIVKEPHWPSSLPEICLMRPSLLTWQHGEVGCSESMFLGGLESVLMAHPNQRGVTADFPTKIGWQPCN